MRERATGDAEAGDTGDTTVSRRIRAGVAGLSAGDALSWPAWWHRMSQLPPRRAVRLGEAWDHAREGRTTSLPTPYLQSSAPSLVDPAGPTDDVEWFAVAVRHHLGQRLDGSPAPAGGSVWTELAELRGTDEGSVRGRIGTVIALDNLASGLAPPATGNDNPHYFDDIACVRALAAGFLRPGDAGRAADLADSDAVITHALDGLWGARATAALMSELASGADRSTAIDAARRELPWGSWCAHVTDECLKVANPELTAVDLAARLESDVVDHVYAFSNQAPETLGLLLAHLAVAVDGPSMLLGVLSHPRHADGLVPLAGAVAGACFGSVTSDRSLPVLGGVCVRPLAGVSLQRIVTEVVERAAGAEVSR